jgi:hypothetical protein
MRLYSTQLLSVDRPNSTCFNSFLPSDHLIRHFQQKRTTHNTEFQADLEIATI